MWGVPSVIMLGGGAACNNVGGGCRLAGPGEQQVKVASARGRMVARGQSLTPEPTPLEVLEGSLPVLAQEGGPVACRRRKPVGIELRFPSPARGAPPPKSVSNPFVGIEWGGQRGLVCLFNG